MEFFLPWRVPDGAVRVSPGRLHVYQGTRSSAWVRADRGLRGRRLIVFIIGFFSSALTNRPDHPPAREACFPPPLRVGLTRGRVRVRPTPAAAWAARRARTILFTRPCCRKTWVTRRILGPRGTLLIPVTKNVLFRGRPFRTLGVGVARGRPAGAEIA